MLFFSLSLESMNFAGSFIKPFFKWTATGKTRSFDILPNCCFHSLLTQNNANWPFCSKNRADFPKHICFQRHRTWWMFCKQSAKIFKDGVCDCSVVPQMYHILFCQLAKHTYAPKRTRWNRKTVSGRIAEGRWILFSACLECFQQRQKHFTECNIALVTILWSRPFLCGQSKGV